MRKGGLSTVILIVVFLVGLGLLLYPTISDRWNAVHQSRAISLYTQQVADLDNSRYELLWQQAREYNQRLLEQEVRFQADPEPDADSEYNSLLDVSGTGIMGYVDIPSIDCSLPIYHGTDEAVLQVAIGHIMGSSLPVGGESTHCVLSGHRGLPSARLFTDLDQLQEGDTFSLRILDEVLTYEVDQIRIVEPHELEELEIIEGKDYCTLVTCTPYGINTHRLLVRGERTETQTQAEEIVRVPADAMQIEPTLVAPAVAAPMLLVLLLWLLLSTRRRRD